MHEIYNHEGMELLMKISKSTAAYSDLAPSILQSLLSSTQMFCRAPVNTIILRKPQRQFRWSQHVAGYRVESEELDADSG